MRLAAFQHSATTSVAHHTAHLVAAIVIAVIAFFGAGGEDDAKPEAQRIASSTATGGL